MSEHTASPPSTSELFGSNRMWGLKELPAPDPVSWWPQTPGWYVLGLVLLLALAWFCRRLYRRYQRDRYRRTGLAQLTAMASDLSALPALPVLLRQSALNAAAREDVAGLRGEAWIAWLNGCAGQVLFKNEDADALDRLAYGKGDDAHIERAVAQHLIEASEKWMRSHRAAV